MGVGDGTDDRQAETETSSPRRYCAGYVYKDRDAIVVGRPKAGQIDPNKLNALRTTEMNRHGGRRLF